LLKHAFSVAQNIMVGVTINGMNQHKAHDYNIETYETRKKSVAEFVKKMGKTKQSQAVKLIDVYGPTLKDSKIDCLVVSPLTKPGAVKISQKRQELGLKTLPIEVCQLEKCSDGQYISSTRIREGEINREGFVYIQIFNKDLILNSDQKQELKNPLGELIQNPNPEKIANQLDPQHLNVAIGDMSSIFAHQNNLPVQVFVFDNKEQRQDLDSSIDNLLTSPDILTCANPAGQIKQNLIKTLQSSFTHKNHLKIDGEEDLAVLPAILLLPLGSTILYGQPNEGLVLVVVTEEKKEWCKDFLSSFWT